MSEQDPPVTEPVVTEVKHELDDKGDKLSKSDLDGLRDELKNELATLRRDRAMDDEEKAEMKAKIEKQEERIEELLRVLEEHDKVRSDSSTIILPPDHLNPRQQNPNPEPDDTSTGSEESGSGEKKKRRLGWY